MKEGDEHGRSGNNARYQDDVEGSDVLLHPQRQAGDRRLSQDGVGVRCVLSDGTVVAFQPVGNGSAGLR